MSDPAPSPKTRRTGPRYSATGFIVYAECYGRAAWRTQAAGGLPHNAPVGTFAVHCAELALKAVLLKQGRRAHDLKRLGHDLSAIFEATGITWEAVGLTPLELNFWSDAVKSTTMRYMDSELYYVIESSQAVSFMEKLFHYCLEVVLPGARRSLRH